MADAIGEYQDYVLHKLVLLQCEAIATAPTPWLNLTKRMSNFKPMSSLSKPVNQINLIKSIYLN